MAYPFALSDQLVLDIVQKNIIINRRFNYFKKNLSDELTLVVVKIIFKLHFRLEVDTAGV